jgi:hypothetical protein
MPLRLTRGTPKDGGEGKRSVLARRLYNRVCASIEGVRRLRRVSKVEASHPVAVDVRLLGARLDVLSRSGDRDRQALGMKDCCRGRGQPCRACIREGLFRRHATLK